MIPNQWYAILESNEIKKGKLIGVTRMGEKLVVWRNSQGKLSVLSDKCPHRGVALSVGKVMGDCIRCPFHGFEYNSSGVCTLVPAIGGNTEPPKALHVHSYPVCEAHGFVYIWWGEPRDDNPGSARESYPPLPYFDAATQEQ